MLVVRFYAEDLSKRQVEVPFTSEHAAQKFVEEYEYLGEFKRFGYDFLYDTQIGRVKKWNCSRETFWHVYLELYPYEKARIEKQRAEQVLNRISEDVSTH